MSNEEHEKGIVAAIRAGEEVDWVMGLLGSGIGSGQELFEDQLRAYLSASGLVLVPREPSADMVADGMEVYCRKDDVEEDVWSIYNEMLSAAPNPFESKQDE